MSLWNSAALERFLPSLGAFSSSSSSFFTWRLIHRSLLAFFCSLLAFIRSLGPPALAGRGRRADDEDRIVFTSTFSKPRPFNVVLVGDSACTYVHLLSAFFLLGVGHLRLLPTSTPAQYRPWGTRRRGKTLHRLANMNIRRGEK
jgi:hypothetical protein